MSFFELGKTQKPKRSKSATRRTRTGCEACGRGKQPYPIKGKGGEGILIVYEFPENQRGENVLQRELLRHGIDAMRDCYITYANLCAGRKVPDANQVKACRPYLLKAIEDLKPKMIIAVGNNSVKSLITEKARGRITGIKASAYYGERIPDRDYGLWICPIYDGKYIMQREDKGLEKVYAEMVKRIAELAGSPLPTLSNDIEYTEDAGMIFDWLVRARKQAKVLAFDYETTGLKPHREGHEIVCASIAYDGRGYSFPLLNDVDVLEEWRALMLDERIKKIAHNASFEIMWTKQICGYTPENVWWDTQTAAHIEHNTKPTNLKFQTYCKLGVIGFDNKVDVYITQKRGGEDDKGGNAFVRTKEAPTKELLKYNALDSLYTLQLYEYQKKELWRMGNKFVRAQRFFCEGVNTFAKMSINGMRIDTKKMAAREKELTEKISTLDKKIKALPEYKKSPTQPFNYDSHSQLAGLLYDILEHTPIDGKRSTDEAALEKMNTEFTRAILESRKYKKLRDTYIGQFERELVGDKIYPFYGLSRVSSYRSSGSMPNFQNIPKRGKDAEMIRELIIPSKGNRLIEYDYKGVEVAIGACVHKDPNMIMYVTDPETDMHRDTANDMFIRPNGFTEKEERQIGKNGFVFPSFYGAGVSSIAPRVWELIGKETKRHLKEKGIKTYARFEKHIQKVFSEFWEGRFAAYNEWRQKTHRDMERNGYIDLQTGFRCYAPISFTQSSNLPIQGVAFHCLLWTLIRIEPLIAALGGRSKIIGQIHDAIVMDVHPDDEKAIDGIVKEWGTEKIREEWDWIIVPLQIEKERSAIDGNWAAMEACGYI